MKVKKDQIDLPELGQPDEFGGLDPQEIISHKREISTYIKRAQEHLLALKKELYQVIDAGFDDARGYNLQSEENTEVNYDSKPSVFLEKAYTIQAYDNEGKLLVNRDQPYIDAGKNFADFCDNERNELDADRVLLNDAGRLISAINSALSQLNHVEHSLKFEEYERAALQAPQIKLFNQAVIESSERSNIIKVIPNQTYIQRLLSGLEDLFKNMGQLFANLGKKKDQIHKEAFRDIQEKYKQSAVKDENIVKDNEEISSGPSRN